MRSVVFVAAMMAVLALVCVVWIGMQTEKIVARKCQIDGKLPIYTRSGVICGK